MIRSYGAWLGSPGAAVADREERVVAEAVEPGAGGVHEHRVDVDGVHGGVAEHVAHQGGVVAGARADLQHPEVLAEVEGVEHAHHQ